MNAPRHLFLTTIPCLVLLALTCMSVPFKAMGQARRDVVQNTPADLIWHDGVEEAQMAMSNGELVLAIDLSRNRLKSLPDGLQQFKDLRYLLLNRNRLRDLPDWLPQMGQLQALILDHNRFDDFPEVLLSMPQLEQLSIGENYLRGIPLDIDHMQGLKYLSLWGNVLASFPASLGDVPDLKVLDLLHNEMTVDEHEMLKELLPEVQLNMSQPCNCKFDTGFSSYPTDRRQ